MAATKHDGPDMTALKYDMQINQGETWSITFPVFDSTGNPLTVDGWTARAQIRQETTSPGVLFEWSTALGNMTVAGTTVTLRLTPVDTATWYWHIGLYDIELSDPGGNITRIVEGNVIVDAEITH